MLTPSASGKKGEEEGVAAYPTEKCGGLRIEEACVYQGQIQQTAHFPGLKPHEWQPGRESGSQSLVHPAVLLSVSLTLG